jgi:hypothetical protein
MERGGGGIWKFRQMKGEKWVADHDHACIALMTGFILSVDKSKLGGRLLMELWSFGDAWVREVRGSGDWGYESTCVQTNKCG